MTPCEALAACVARAQGPSLALARHLRAPHSARCARACPRSWCVPVLARCAQANRPQQSPTQLHNCCCSPTPSVDWPPRVIKCMSPIPHCAVWRIPLLSQDVIQLHVPHPSLCCVARTTALTGRHPAAAAAANHWDADGQGPSLCAPPPCARGARCVQQEAGEGVGPQRSIIRLRRRRWSKQGNRVVHADSRSQMLHALAVTMGVSATRQQEALSWQACPLC